VFLTNKTSNRRSSEATTAVSCSGGLALLGLAESAVEDIAVFALRRLLGYAETTVAPMTMPAYSRFGGVHCILLVFEWVELVTA